MQNLMSSMIETHLTEPFSFGADNLAVSVPNHFLIVLSRN